MKKGWLVILLLGVIIIVGAIVLFVMPASTAHAPTGGTAAANGGPNQKILTLDNLNPGSTITSPLTITGSLLNTFYFEGSFPVALKDASGKILTQTPAQQTPGSDWTKPGPVSFSVTLTFAAQPAGATGTLEFLNDNPSGDPATQREIDVPVKF